MIRRQKVLCIIGSVAVQACNGGLYAWSALVPALRETYGLSSAQLAAVFSATMACFVGTMVLAGPWQERHGPRLAVLLASMLFGLGHLLAAHSGGHYGALLLGLGALNGAAIGLGYVTALTVCARLFPGRAGLVTGVVVAGFGASGMVMSQVAAAQLAQGLDVLTLLGRIGVVYVVIVAAGALTMPARNAMTPPDDAPPPRLQIGALSDRATWALMLGMFVSTFGGLLVISHLNPIALGAGASGHVATWAVGAFAVGNAGGRLLWGHLADRFGRPTIQASLVCLVAALLALAYAQTSGALIVASALLGLCFGAAFVVYAAQVAATHGSAGLSFIYPWVFVCYGIAGITGPTLGGRLADAMGDYRPAILLAAAVTTVGVVGISLLWQRARPQADSPQTHPVA